MFEREYFIEGLFKGYINLQKVSLKLKDKQLIDYLNFSGFNGEIQANKIEKEMWAVLKKEVELGKPNISFDLKKAIKRLQ